MSCILQEYGCLKLVRINIIMIKFQIIFQYILQSVSMIITIIFFSACHSFLHDTNNVRAEIKTIKVEDVSSLKSSQKKFKEIIHNLEIKSRIMNQYANWKGVHYRFGGNTKKGIDCSSFVQRTFREQFKLSLPRSTYKQQEIGKSISRNRLRIGDLVLFRTSSTGRHIGIYIGNNQFVHVSTSNGVTISSMNKPYWRSHYNKARRVLTRS